MAVLFIKNEFSIPYYEFFPSPSPPTPSPSLSPTPSCHMYYYIIFPLPPSPHHSYPCPISPFIFVFFLLDRLFLPRLTWYTMKKKIKNNVLYLSICKQYAVFSFAFQQVCVYCEPKCNIKIYESLPLFL